MTRLVGQVKYLDLLLKSNRVARHFLDSRAITIYEGTNEILQLKVASKILGNEYEAYDYSAEKEGMIGFLNKN
ncbi:MAG TPA: acyl-CoA dehydrogenase family protein [Candidatus Eisenbacteria bacterium]|nr:acyl-CoA dehydrogenase family protein [Candidatus Eisenbacteria bacterium]